MFFADLFFLYFFLPLCLICYFITRNTSIRNVTLIVFSLIFYAWGEPVWVCILPVSALINHLAGRVIENRPRGASAKLAAALAVIFDLGLLVGFRYAGSVTQLLNSAAGLGLPVPQIRIPVGISIYTLRTVSYVVDCYRGKVEPQKSFMRSLLYVSLFPLTITGPVVRFSAIGEELADRKTTIKDFSEGFSRIILGLGKKTLIADGLGKVVYSLFGSSADGYAAAGTLSVLGAWFGIAAAGLWYYFVFSGYADIAIGLGRIFGFHFEENFKYPFVSRNVTDFWKRWFITVSSFFREYVAGMPLFGKRLKTAGAFLAWLLMGIWFGTSWNFIIFGAYFGFFIMLETIVGRKRMKKLPAFLGHIYTKLIVFLGFGIFYFESLPRLSGLFKSLIGMNGGGLTDSRSINILMGNIFLLIAAAIFSAPIIPKLKKKAFKRPGSAYIFQSAGVICNALILLASSLLLLRGAGDMSLYYRS